MLGKKEIKRIYVLLFVILGLFLTLVLIGKIYIRMKILDVMTKISVGMPEEDVINALGKPGKIFYKGEETEFFRSWYPIPKKSITNKVFFYSGPLMYGVYIFFDVNNQVECIYWVST